MTIRPEDLYTVEPPVMNRVESTYLPEVIKGFGTTLKHFVTSFAGERFRVGAFAMFWLFATALVIGLGLGPVIVYYANADETALTQAFAGTAATVLGPSPTR